MTVDNELELEGLRRAGRVVALALEAMRKAVRPGVTTAGLDAIAAAVMKEHRARSAPIVTYKFPGYTCISINEEAAHGIPGARVVQDGDLVNLDVSLELDGYFADAAITVPVGAISPRRRKLLQYTETALQNGLTAARAGQRINAIGRAIEQTARKGGFAIIRQLPGHGVGHALHEEPTVPGFYSPQASTRLVPGMVITIEPFLSAGAWQIEQRDDGWTLVTIDGSDSAQVEHTIVITKDRPIILTAL